MDFQTFYQVCTLTEMGVICTIHMGLAYATEAECIARVFLDAENIAKAVHEKGVQLLSISGACGVPIDSPAPEVPIG